MQQFLIEFITVLVGAGLGCLTGVYLSDVLVFRRQRLQLQREIDKRVQDLLDSSAREHRNPDQEVGKNLNIRV